MFESVRVTVLNVYSQFEKCVHHFAIAKGTVPLKTQLECSREKESALDKGLIAHTALRNCRTRMQGHPHRCKCRQPNDAAGQCKHPAFPQAKCKHGKNPGSHEDQAPAPGKKTTCTQALGPSQANKASYSIALESMPRSLAYSSVGFYPRLSGARWYSSGIPPTAG